MYDASSALSAIEKSTAVHPDCDGDFGDAMSSSQCLPVRQKMVERERGRESGMTRDGEDACKFLHSANLPVALPLSHPLSPSPSLSPSLQLSAA